MAEAEDADASMARLPTMRVSIDHALLGTQEFDIDLNLGLNETELQAVASAHSEEVETSADSERQPSITQKFSELYFYGIFGFILINFAWIGMVVIINRVYGFNVFAP
ncbi:hypothetical protein GUITHDRAFT_118339 [Guillardia theta CCMP2712]|uniref:Uncharacterized protein n=2 Tax=Guillardia theta TaxID=55529 RepID=L1II85_GUITC|nr:hypothetical protein GUITHDRAFT_118339 [Guillardia theta CCMP2712]EKX35530.1 hypothetical protein GUITHDRAFT_118339 [Guillardia theta CCMP2712]|mmetsp:Transcript_39442/g.124175  ORF Transcript_39442/g.124175 Transcript_39442/m.124175 type:complete len:108 (+) Transcript_39442:1-324(+)|eukprot:XP_005822510.1 hypothetical protein GUITHDRAFT_118339 [Guillardia theta CCMP2712]